MEKATANSLSPELARSALLYCLHYFAFFKHALSLEELERYSPLALSRTQIRQRLQRLEQEGQIVGHASYYALEAEHLKRRLDHEQRNWRNLARAKKVGRFIGAFPFVRGVYISGSLSKLGFSGADEDYDFFIITRAGRLWTARFFLILFKKTLLFNSKRFFCLNLFRSEADLSFKQPNRYVATELASLVPVVSKGTNGKLWQANTWLAEYFPNFRPWPAEPVPQQNSPALAPSAFETWAMRLFQRQAGRKYGAKQGAHLDFRPDAAALFPNNHQSAVLRHLASCPYDFL